MTVTTSTPAGNEAQGFAEFISDFADPTEDIQLSKLRRDLTHGFLGVEFFEADEITSVTMTAGTVQVLPGVSVDGQVPETVTDGDIDVTLTSGKTRSWAGPVDRVTCTPAALAGPSFARWRIKIHQSRS